MGMLKEQALIEKVNSYTLINLTDKNQGDISCINLHNLIYGQVV